MTIINKTFNTTLININIVHLYNTHLQSLLKLQHCIVCAYKKF